MLATLPDWLAELETTATGGGKTSAPVRRTPRYRRPLDGDAYPIAAYPNSNEESVAKAIRDRYDAVLRDALARGRVNARASELAEKVHGALLMWVRDLCETRGIELPTFDEVRVCGESNEAQLPAPWMDASTVHVAEGNPGSIAGSAFSTTTEDVHEPAPGSQVRVHMRRLQARW